MALDSYREAQARGSRARILVLTTTLPEEPGDGVPQFVYDLSRGLAETNDVVILAPRTSNTPPVQHWNGVSVRRFAYFPKPWEALADGAILPNLAANPVLYAQVPALLASFQEAAFRLSRSWKPDLVHAHWVLPAGGIARLVLARYGIPYIVTVHGADAFALDGPGVDTLKRAVLRSASSAGLTSTAVGEALPAGGWSQRHVIPMGVDVREIAEQVGERIPVRGRFLYVGRLASKKGIDVLLEALVHVPEARLDVAGDGPEEAALHALASRLQITDRVEFHGRVGRRRLAGLMRTAGAVVIPSRVAEDGDQDTTPLVMSESMSAGVPVIASAIGGLAERIRPGETGLLVEPDSPSPLATAMQWMLDHPSEAQQLAREARDWIEGSPLDLRSTWQAYQALVEDAIDGRSER